MLQHEYIAVAPLTYSLIMCSHLSHTNASIIFCSCQCFTPFSTQFFFSSVYTASFTYRFFSTTPTFEHIDLPLNRCLIGR